MPDPAWRRSFRRRLLAWFAGNARDLPWRRTGDPYRVWISEVMLQQTQVATVIPYYERFVAALPDVRSLAAADEREVLRLWEGLGYYRRARQLHEAARKIVNDHDGRLPRDAEALRALPGIGRYTAGAILSIACSQREPILEANTIRLLSRLLAQRDDPRRGAARRRLWQFAGELLPRKDPGRFNQALMELGAIVCLPRSPRCVECPVAGLCAAHEHSLQEVIPTPPQKTPYEDVREAAVVVRRRGKVLLIQQQEGQRWAGLWDFVRFPLDDAQTHGEEGTATLHEIARSVADITGIEIGPPRPLATIRHGVTRFRITLECYQANCTSAARRRQNRQMQWVKPEELERFPLSSPARKLARLA